MDNPPFHHLPFRLPFQRRGMEIREQKFVRVNVKIKAISKRSQAYPPLTWRKLPQFRLQGLDFCSKGLHLLGLGG